MSTEKRINGSFFVTVVHDENGRASITNDDAEMDNRARAAVKAAIDKAKLCKKPVAGYDAVSKRAYLEYANGERKYV